MPVTAESLISLLLSPRPVRPRVESDAPAVPEPAEMQIGRILEPQAVLPEETKADVAS
jgi:hypothetical protein